MDEDHWLMIWEHVNHPPDIEGNCGKSCENQKPAKGHKALSLDIAPEGRTDKCNEPEGINWIIEKCPYWMQGKKAKESPGHSASRAWKSTK